LFLIFFEKPPKPSFPISNRVLMVFFMVFLWFISITIIFDTSTLRLHNAFARRRGSTLQMKNTILHNNPIIVVVLKVFYTECPLVKLSYFTLEKSIFFSCITSFFPLISKLATVARGHPKIIRTRSLIRKLGFGGF
jgi:hypothetical protein